MMEMVASTTLGDFAPKYDDRDDECKSKPRH